MPRYVAKRFRFQNGEHHSVLKGPNGLPVHAVTLFLQKFRKRGRAANTIHAVCQCLALLYRELDAKPRIDLLGRLRDGQFLTVSELARLADVAQYPMKALAHEEEQEATPQVGCPYWRANAASRDCHSAGVDCPGLVART